MITQDHSPFDGGRPQHVQARIPFPMPPPTSSGYPQNASLLLKLCTFLAKAKATSSRSFPTHPNNTETRVVKTLSIALTGL